MWAMFGAHQVSNEGVVENRVQTNFVRTRGSSKVDHNQTAFSGDQGDLVQYQLSAGISAH